MSKPQGATADLLRGISVFPEMLNNSAKCVAVFMLFQSSRLQQVPGID